MTGPLIAPFPEHGIWTRLGLGRGQFLGILALSIVLFLLVGGPVWLHVHDEHFRRIALSYGIIPLAVGAALWRNRALRPGLLVGGSAVIAGLKLVITAGLLLVLAIARGR